MSTTGQKDYTPKDNARMIKYILSLEAVDGVLKFQRDELAEKINAEMVLSRPANEDKISRVVASMDLKLKYGKGVNSIGAGNRERIICLEAEQEQMKIDFRGEITILRNRIDELTEIVTGGNGE